MAHSELVAACSLIVLALMHSGLGEARVVRPLLRQDWRLGLPRSSAEQLIRFAWHLPTVAWVALALVLLGADPLVGALVVAGSAWFCLFVWLRGHPAWPLFLLVTCASLLGLGVVPHSLFGALGLGTAGAFAGLSVLHIYWAFGGSWLIDSAVPTHPDGSSPFSPGRALTLLVAAGLGVFGAVVAAHSLNIGPPVLGWIVGAGAGVFLIRAAGDGRFVGFTKTIRGTPFARADDVWFTPACVLLAFGAVSSMIA